MVAGSQSVERPDEVPLTRDAVVARLSTPFPGLGATLYWVARSGGTIEGVAQARLPEDENAHLGLVEVVVRPDVRGRGLGSALYAAVVPELRSRGRTVVETSQVVAGGDGERWAVGRGFGVVRSIAVQSLSIADADRSLWTVDVPDGYRVLRWRGTAPDEWVASYAEARGGIHDAPVGGQDRSEPDWTVERVRRAEEEFHRQDVDQRVVVVVHEATGRVVGLTEVIVLPYRQYEALQGDTVVVAAHRGHGLGRCLKGTMSWWLAGRPGLQHIRTATSTDNAHMLAVNHALGYATVRTMLTVNAELPRRP